MKKETELEVYRDTLVHFTQMLMACFIYLNGPASDEEKAKYLRESLESFFGGR